MKDKKVYYRLRKEMEANYIEIGKVCTELQYYQIKNKNHLKVPYLQYRLERLLLANYKLLIRVKALEKGKDNEI